MSKKIKYDYINFLGWNEPLYRKHSLPAMQVLFKALHINLKKKLTEKIPVVADNNKFSSKFKLNIKIWKH